VTDNNFPQLLDTIDALPHCIVGIDAMRELRTIAERDRDLIPERFFKSVIVTAVLAASAASYYEENPPIELKALIVLAMQQLSMGGES
jgi:hypothetical protein